MKTQYKPILVSALLVLLSFVCTAQNSESSIPAPNNSMPPPGPGLPIDGGVYVVAGLALAYGAYKKRKALK
ncbi:MAG: hypothetical protein GYB39_02195 [Algicola sp.]|nr:hypothetical protein [Algicola sp.]